MSNGKNYIYVAKDLKTYESKIEEGTGLAFTRLDAIAKAAERVGKSDQFQGKTADSIRQYLQTTYPTIITMFEGLLKTALDGFGAYVLDYLTLTGADKTSYDERISTNELDSISQKLKEYGDEANEVEEDFNTSLTTLYNNGDIGFTYTGPANVPGCYTYLKKMVDDLVTGIETIEGKTGEIQDLRDTETKIGQYLDYLFSITPDTFDVNAYATYLHKSETVETFQTMISNAAGKEEKAAQARQILLEMTEQEIIDERKKREKEAGFWGAVTDIVCGVAVVVATATLGPVGTIAVGAITGTIKSAVHEGLDQYVETGAGLGELDWGRIAIKGTVGGLTGAATSAIGVGAGGLTNSLGSLGTGFKTLGNIGIGIGKNGLNTLVEHGGSALETGFIGLYEGKSWKNAWNEAGVAFTSDLGKDLVNGTVTGITSNLTGFTGNMKDGWGKALTNTAINTGAGMVDYSVKTALDGGKIELKDAFAAGAKSGMSTIISEGFSYMRSDNVPISSWEKKSGNKLGYLTAIAGGTAEGYLKTSTGGFVEGLIKGDDNAADSFRLLDKDGVPTSALSDAIKGGAKSGSKLYYDRNLSEESTPKTEDIKRDVVDKDGKVIGEEVIGKRTITRYETAFGGKRKVVAETYTKVQEEQGENGIKVTTESTTYYEKGQKIGSGTKTTIESKASSTGESVTKLTNENYSYTRNDKTVVDSTSKSVTKFDADTGKETTTGSEDKTTQNNNWSNHSRNEVHKDTTVTKEDGVTTTNTDKYDTTYNKKEDVRIYKETHSEKSEYTVGEGKNAETHSVTREEKSTTTKNDIGNRHRIETERTNTSSNGGKTTRSRTYIERGKENEDGSYTSKAFDNNTSWVYE